MKTKIVRQFTVMAFLLRAAPAFFFATYQLFLTEHGLNILEISLINSAYMISVFVLEVPTGAFADSYGRRQSIIWGCLILSLSFIGYFFANNFLGFILAEIVGALGSCLISGALEAWVVDALEEEKIDEPLETLFKREEVYKQYGVISGSIAGALIGSINLGIPWLLSGLAMLLAALYARRLKCDAKHKHKNFKFDLTPLRNTITESWHSGRTNPAFLRLAATGTVLAMSVQSLNMQWPILFNQRFDLPIWSLGLIFAGIAAFTALGARFAPLAARKSRHEGHSLAIALLITGVMMILSGQASFVAPALLFFLLHELGRGLFSPLKKAMINRRIDGQNRATMLSLDSMALSAGAFIGLVGGGWLGTQSIALAWTVSGLLLVSLFPLLYKKGI
ncbi:MAG: MFS transporter [bacterium]|nr:MFS transporter [bacterium]